MIETPYQGTPFKHIADIELFLLYNYANNTNHGGAHPAVFTQLSMSAN